MNSLLAYFDFKSALIDSYKSFDLDEYDVILLLLLENILKHNPFASAPELSPLMTINEEEIDVRLSKLIVKKYIKLETINKEARLTLKPLITMLATNATRTLDIEHKEIFELFEQELARPLNPLEISIIDDWLTAKVEKKDIVNAWRMALEDGVRTINYCDGIIARMKKI